jgi:hypothetical protein
MYHASGLLHDHDSKRWVSKAHIPVLQPAAQLYNQHDGTQLLHNKKQEETLLNQLMQ